MKKYLSAVFILSIILFSCSTGKKALQKGDYYSAVLKAVDRLKSDPDNKNATNVLKEGYPLALEWTQEELDQILTLNEPFKWGKAVGVMEQVNRLSDEIRQAPAARKIISNPRVYTSELNNGKERAAEEQYLAAEELMKQETREAARQAFDHYFRANQFVPGYRDVIDKLEDAKSMATLTVIIEAIPVHAQAYELSSNFFYNQVFEYLNNKYPQQSFVNFFAPAQAEQEGLEYPDMMIRLEFYDFSVGNTEHTESEKDVRAIVHDKTVDTLRSKATTYRGKLKTITDRVKSGGILEMKIIDFQTNKLLESDRISGSFTWENQYGIYIGDKEVLQENKEYNELTKRKAAPLPSSQDLFIEFTKPIYDQLTGKLNRFFRDYD